MRKVWEFFKGTLVLVARGSRAYYAWVLTLLFLMAVGAAAYAYQLRSGLIVTAMRDQDSWGLYISNFTFLVGVAAAAVLLVIPAYVYKWQPIKEIAVGDGLPVFQPESPRASEFAACSMASRKRCAMRSRSGVSSRGRCTPRLRTSVSSA